MFTGIFRQPFRQSQVIEALPFVKPDAIPQEARPYAEGINGARNKSSVKDGSQHCQTVLIRKT